MLCGGVRERRIAPLLTVAACAHRSELLTVTERGLGRSSTRLEAMRQLLVAVQRAMKAGRGLRLGRIPVPELGGKNPLMLLNEFKQTGKISKVGIEDPKKDAASRPCSTARPARP